LSSQATYGDPDTRERILVTTRALVAERGANLKLGEVADRAGVSRQAVYLHFGDRTGLLLALVQHMDQSLALNQSLTHVFQAQSGIEVIARTMALHSEFSAAIDPVALILEAAQYEDEALGAAWRDRMRFRHQVHRKIVERIAELGDLADTWTRDAAADLFYAVTLPGTWRELTREHGWTRDRYVDLMTTMLSRALLAPRRGRVSARGQPGRTRRR
jgi:AcrR family transcriptional regulator